MEREGEAGVEPLVGSLCGSYDNAMAENIIGLHEAELIEQREPWRNLNAVEYATLAWVQWSIRQRLFEPIGNVRPAEFEAEYTRQNLEFAIAA